MSIYEYYSKAYKVSTDSRQVEKDAVFFALKGEHFDGNDFALEVAEKGIASLVVADRESLPNHPRIMKVQDALLTLQGLALYHRLLMKLKVIGITGTNGKTTTKELVSAVLAKKYNILYTQGNYNNHLGVPLTLLRATPGTQIAVVEMGANHPGEINHLCKIADPNYGIITNIGRAHLEGFGNFQGVVNTKNELYQYLREHHGMAFVNKDNDLLMQLSEGLDRYTYGTDEADTVVKPYKFQHHPYLSVQNFYTGVIATQLVGDYNFENVAAAIGVGNYFEVDDDDIVRALQDYKPTNSRSQVIKGRNTIVMDAYNANPTSMNASVRSFREICGERPLLILGDMRELGEASETEHKTILHLLKELGFHEAFLVGPNFGQYNDNPEYLTFATSDDLASYLESHPVSQRHILVKGSRGIQLERILPQIQ